MSYQRAEDCLPPQLIAEIQKYVQGTQLYIPGQQDCRRSWGEKNGTREKLRRRNQKIREMKSQGSTIDNLADEFNLSSDSIRKILYGKKATA